MESFSKKIKAYIEQFSMLRRGDRVLVGVSGGADSMCLLSVLEGLSKELGIDVLALHIHHGLRGEEADGDEAYVAEYCKKHSIEFYAEHFEVAKEAKKNGWSTEEAGRILRYRAFEERATQSGCSRIAVAHHQEDNAETVLFQIFRGTGLNGLCGIPPVRGKIIRPLLCVGRKEIETYLEMNKLSFRTDSSNLTADYSRNKIRHKLLPYISQELNVQAVRHIAELAEQMREWKEFLNQTVAELYHSMVSEDQGWLRVECSAFLRIPPILRQELLLYLFGKLETGGQGRKNITYQHLETVSGLAQKQAGCSFCLPNDIRVVKNYSTLDFICGSEKVAEALQESVWIDCDLLPFVRILPEGKDLPCSGYRLSIFMEDYKNSIKIPKNRYTKWYDYDKIGNTLELRTRKPGDMIQISSDGKQKTLNRLLIDCKIPRDARDACPLLASGNEILLVPGLRSGEGYYVTEETKKILIVCLEPPEQILEGTETRSSVKYKTGI